MIIRASISQSRHDIRTAPAANALPRMIRTRFTPPRSACKANSTYERSQLADAPRPVSSRCAASPWGAVGCALITNANHNHRLPYRTPPSASWPLVQFQSHVRSWPRCPAGASGLAASRRSLRFTSPSRLRLRSSSSLSPLLRCGAEREGFLRVGETQGRNAAPRPSAFRRWATFLQPWRGF